MNKEKRNKLIEYYKKYKKLAICHKNLYGDEKSPDIPSLFSEDLCRELLGLSTSDCNKYDGIKDNNYYEIKATCLPNNKTTFSKDSKPDKIVWMSIDVYNDKLIIYYIKKSFINKKMQCSNSNGNRVSISFTKSSIESECKKVDLNTLCDLK